MSLDGVKPVWARLVFLIGTSSLLLVSAGCSSGTGPSSLEERAQAIDKSLICPVCPGETIDQSQVELAKQMRVLVRDKLAEGWARGEILQFFVDRYGLVVLAEPPKRGFNLLIWVIPPVALVMGGLVLVMAVRGMRRLHYRYAQDEEPLPMAELEPYLARVDREIERLMATGKEKNRSSSGELSDEEVGDSSGKGQNS